MLSDMRGSAGTPHDAAICWQRVLFPSCSAMTRAGLIVFQLDDGCECSSEWTIFARPEQLAAGERAAMLFKQWRDNRQAVLCWLWIAKQLQIARDIRVLIADLIWKDRAAWSERRVAE